MGDRENWSYTMIWSYGPIFEETMRDPRGYPKGSKQSVTSFKVDARRVQARVDRTSSARPEFANDGFPCALLLVITIDIAATQRRTEGFSVRMFRAPRLHVYEHPGV